MEDFSLRGRTAHCDCDKSHDAQTPCGPLVQAHIGIPLQSGLFVVWVHFSPLIFYWIYIRGIARHGTCILFLRTGLAYSSLY